MPEPYPIDADVILKPLDELLEAFLNLIRREWPAGVPSHPFSPTLLRGFIAIARNTFRTMRYFSADKDRDKEPERRLEYSKCAPPLARVILEIVFNTVFVLDDFPIKTSWFEKASWRGMREDLTRFEDEFGNDPVWTEHLARLRAHVDQGVGFFGINSAEVANLDLIRPWPTPGKMKKAVSSERAAFIEYLHTWFYGSFSEDAHVKAVGFMRAIAGLLPDLDPRDLTEDLHKQAMSTIATTAGLMAALISEIQLVLKFESNVTPRLKNSWVLIGEVSSPCERLYRRRYQALL
jgi:hypothetical protein